MSKVDEIAMDRMLDALQMAYNDGAFQCPLAGRSKPTCHVNYCQACEVRNWLVGKRFVIAETETQARRQRDREMSAVGTEP